MIIITFLFIIYLCILSYDSPTGVFTHTSHTNTVCGRNLVLVWSPSLHTAADVIG